RFWKDGDLFAMDEIIQELQRSHKILPSVLKLQQYGDHTYGIAYAIGTTFYSYRKDWLREAGINFDLNPPRTWNELLNIMPQLEQIARQKGADGAVVLPGGDPFFLDQLFIEVLSSLGGSLFEQVGSDFHPQFTSDKVTE